MEARSHHARGPDMRKREQRLVATPSRSPAQPAPPPCVTPPAAPASLTPPLRAAHLWQRPFRLPHLDADWARDAEHGGQGHEPADAVAPGGVGVHVVVLGGLVFDQEENEGALQRWGEVPCWPSAWVRRLAGEMADPVHTGLGEVAPCLSTARSWEQAS